MLASLIQGRLWLAPSLMQRLCPRGLGECRCAGHGLRPPQLPDVGTDPVVRPLQIRPRLALLDGLLLDRFSENCYGVSENVLNLIEVPNIICREGTMTIERAAAKKKVVKSLAASLVQVQ